MARFVPHRRPRLPFRIPFFRIFYSTTYTILYILVLVLLCVNPGVMIYTAFDQNAVQYVFEIGGVYVLTALLALFIYFSRLYSNRTVMAGVGKSWIPVEDGEVAKKVRKMIVRALERSAIIALESRPRDLSPTISSIRTNTTSSVATSNKTAQMNQTCGRILKIDPHHPPWGRVSHPGWSTPSVSDTSLAPHIHFRTVIHELPNLIEAKAVSLAPVDPYSTPTNSTAALRRPDPAMVGILQRNPQSDVRAYLAQLSQLDLVNPPEAGERFLHQYDRARFSSEPLSETEFEDLIDAFAHLLEGMTALNPALVSQVRANSSVNSSDTSSISGSVITASSASSTSSSTRSASIAGSVRQARRAQLAHRTPSLYTSLTRDSYATAESAAALSANGSDIPTSPSTFRSPTTPRLHTAHTRFSQSLGQSTLKREVSRETLASVGSVLRTVPTSDAISIISASTSSASSARSRSLRSYAGSVVRRSPTAGKRIPGAHGWISPG